VSDQRETRLAFPFFVSAQTVEVPKKKQGETQVQQAGGEWRH
jgi:hypothetical protein